MLHLTKVAFGVASLDAFAERWRLRAEAGEPFPLSTRFLPKRQAEIAGQGSLFWIFKHQLVARSAILGFGESEGGRASILLDPVLVRVQARPRRAHQGWRYLEAHEAPGDLGDGGGEGVEAMPPALLSALSALALI
jgi:hypothetical protein